MIGSIVGNYKVVDKIGEGGMGAVFRGIDMMLEREVAIKVLRAELARRPDIVERFRSEAVTLAKLNHPNIATLYSFFRQGDDFFMVMEFVRGQTLDSVLRSSGAMPLDRALWLFCQALEGIDHAHAMGIVHRDIKPANIMLTDAGSIKVMDFGIARVLGSARMTKQGNVVGTVEYMSPEQVRGLETDARSDIYSLGILLYEMLTGTVPFANQSEYELMKSQIEDAPIPPRSLAAQIPDEVDCAILRALAKDPADRFQTAGEMRAALLTSLGAPSAALAPEAPSSSAKGASAPLYDQTAQASAGAKETVVPPVGRPWREVYGNPAAAKETRIPSAANNPQYWAQPAGMGSPRPASLFARLTWKHYAGIGAALVLVLVVVPLVALTILKAKLQGGGTGPQPVSSASADPASAHRQQETGNGLGAGTAPNPIPSAAGTDSGGGIAAPDNNAPGQPGGAASGLNIDLGQDASGQNHGSAAEQAKARKAAEARKEAEAKREADARDKAKRRAAAERALDE